MKFASCSRQVPIRLKIIAMDVDPFTHQPQCSPRLQSASHDVALMFYVNVRWIMIVEKHAYDDTKKPRDFGHAYLHTNHKKAGARRQTRTSVKIVSYLVVISRRTVAGKPPDACAPGSDSSSSTNTAPLQSRYWLRRAEPALRPHCSRAVAHGITSCRPCRPFHPCRRPFPGGRGLRGRPCRSSA